MGRIIAIANHKGGVGKTTTALNLGYCLGLTARAPVLLADLDPQASLSKSLNAIPGLPSLYHLLAHGGMRVPPQEMIRQTSFCKLRFIAADYQLAVLESQLVARLSRELILKRTLAPLAAPYPFVLLDTPPSLGLLTMNALACADEVLIPVASEFLALQALADFLATVEEVRREINPALKVTGILVTQHNGMTGHGRGSLEALREHFGPQLLDVVIPYSVAAKDAIASGKPALVYDRNCTVALAYQQLAKELSQ